MNPREELHSEMKLNHVVRVTSGGQTNGTSVVLFEGSPMPKLVFKNEERAY